MFQKRFIGIFLVATVAFATLSYLPGQSTTGTILGTAKDQTGGALPGVTITITNTNTGQSRVLVSDDLGNYRAANLALGTYEVNAELAGFKALTNSGIRLTVGSEVVVDMELQVGEVSEEVVVTGGVELVSTTSATLEELVDEQKIRELPLNGRDYLQLTTLTPGVTIMRAQRIGVNPQTGTGLNLSIGGGRPTQNNFRFDGVTVNDHANASPGSTTGANLGVDALREFSVLTNSFSAEYGRAAGGVVNAVIRSGENEVHGSVFFFHRNDNFDARNFFDGADNPEFRRNQFGFSLGGPIVKDRTFLFGSYEGLRELLGQSDSATVPSTAARAGNLVGGSVTVDPAVRPYLDLYPLPAAGTESGDTGEFFSVTDRDSQEDFFVLRGDHEFSTNVRLNASYTFDDAEIQVPDVLLFANNTSPSRRQFVAAEVNWVISPTVVNSTRFGYNRSILQTGLQVPIKEELNDKSLGFIPGGFAGLINPRGGIEDFPGGPFTEDTEFYGFRSYQFYDNVTFVRGNHTLKFGGNLEIIRDKADSSNAQNGEWVFGSFSDFLTNAAADSFVSQLPGSDTVRNLTQEIFGFYVQDDVRVSPNLTLNLGFRWEAATAPGEEDGKAANIFTLTDPATTVGAFFETSKNNFAPRFGFAWDLFGTGKTAIRGGFGLFYDLPLVNLLTIPALRTPPFFRSGATTDLQAGDFPTGGFAKVAGRGTSSVDSVEFNGSPSYLQQWNLNIQQELFPNTILTASYVGSRGVHLSRIGEDENLFSPVVQDGRLFFPLGQDKPNPNFSRIRFWHFDGNSWHHAFNVGINRRFAEGLRIQGSYKYGKTLDLFSATFTSSHYRNTIANPYPAMPDLNRGRADFDIRQTFVLNGTYDLPMNLEGGIGKLTNGWQLGAVFTANTGVGMTPGVAGDQANTGTTRRGRRSGQRPDQVSGATVNGDALVTGDPNNWFDDTVFVLPPDLCPEASNTRCNLGQVGRNVINAPKFVSFDLSLVKDTFVSEEFRIQFRFEAFNLANRSNFDILRLNELELLASDGSIQGSRRIRTTVGTSRQIQLGLKLIF